MTTKTKQTKAQRIAELERKLMEAQAQQVHQLHFASVELGKFNTDRFAASAVIMTLTGLGGGLTMGPVAIRGGLSKATIELAGKRYLGCYPIATGDVAHNGPEPIPESAAECEFGDDEYQWRLRQAGF